MSQLELALTIDRILFADSRVECDTLEHFLDRYYKPDRYHGRGKEYAAAILESHREDLKKYGYDIIAKHDSVTGSVVAWFPKC